MKFKEDISEYTLENMIRLTKDNPDTYQIKNNGELWINYVDKDVLNLLDEVIHQFS